MREKSRHGRFVLLGLFFLTIQQVFTGPGGHALAPYSILMAPLIAFAVDRVWDKAKVIQIVGTALCIYLGFFVGNSHLTIRHIGPVGWVYSMSSSNNFGVSSSISICRSLLPRASMESVRHLPPRETERSALHQYLANVPDDVMREQKRIALLSCTIGGSNGSPFMAF